MSSDVDCPTHIQQPKKGCREDNWKANQHWCIEYKFNVIPVVPCFCGNMETNCTLVTLQTETIGGNCKGQAKVVHVRDKRYTLYSTKYYTSLVQATDCKRHNVSFNKGFELNIQTESVSSCWAVQPKSNVWFQVRLCYCILQTAELKLPLFTKIYEINKAHLISFRTENKGLIDESNSIKTAGR